VVQAFPSLQAVPFVWAGFEHTPVVGSQVPAVWHWSDAAQVLALPAQVPFDEQTSLAVQLLLSLHATPVLMVVVQAAVPLHVRVLQVSLVQVIAVPTHTPLPSQ
jgi:hypothetical protein